MPVERPATHHESRRPVSSLSFNHGGNGVREDQPQIKVIENNFQKYQRQRILLLNRQGGEAEGNRTAKTINNRQS